MNTGTNKVKKKKKNITLGVVHIKATFNNTIVTFTDVQGNTIASASAGAQGLKGTKAATPFAAQATVEKAAREAIDQGVRTLSIEIKGAGIQREAAMRAICQNGAFIVTTIKDVSRVAHNGCRAPKRRRV